MRAAPLFLAAVGVVASGCAARHGGALPDAVVDRPRSTARRIADPARSDSGATPVGMQAYEVREAAFSDFGMSVKTNFDVRWGGRVEWMIVTAIDAASSAERAKLEAGDRILAIDGKLVTAMERDEMLACFFQRRNGETARVLVLGRVEPLPRLVTLAAQRPAAR